jgi:hypothetical protein
MLQVPEGYVQAIAFSPDGKILAAGAAGGKVYLWEAGTGKTLFQLDRANPSGSRFGLAFSGDSKRVAAGGPKVSVWDTATGKRLHLFDETAWHVAFSADGRILLGAGAIYLPSRSEHRDFHPAIFLWDLATANERRVIQTDVHRTAFDHLTLSPDGKTVVLGASGWRVALWEVETGKERRFLQGREVSFPTFAYSPDGRTLATSWGDGIIRIWDVDAPLLPKRERVRQPSLKDLELMWADLAGQDATKAYASILSLTAVPNASVSFLEKRLQPATADPHRIGELIGELDSNQFSVREKATSELVQIGDLVTAQLRDALRRQPSLELRRRLEEMLQKIENQSLSGEPLRILRAMEVLEHIGNVESRRVLEKLAQGAPGARLTREAKLSLQRLAKWAGHSSNSNLKSLPGR